MWQIRDGVSGYRFCVSQNPQITNHKKRDGVNLINMTFGIAVCGGKLIRLLTFGKALCCGKG